MPDHDRRAMKRSYRARLHRAEEQAEITRRADASEHFQLPNAASLSGPPSSSLEGIQDRLGPQPSDEIRSERCSLERRVAAIENKIAQLEKTSKDILAKLDATRKQFLILKSTTSKAVEARKALETKVTRLEVAKKNVRKAFDSLCQKFGAHLQELNAAME